MADLTTLYQGIFGSPWEPTPKSSGQNVGRGRWYTSDPTTARSHAKGLLQGAGEPKLGGRVYSMDLPTKSLSKSTKFTNRLGQLGYEHLAEFGKKPNIYLTTKELIKEGAPKINLGQTALTNLEVLGSKGLGFLKNNALRTLAMLGSLPFQTGLITLAPTRMGNAEIPSHWRPPAHITGGNNGGGGNGNAGGATLSSGMTTGQHAAFRMNNGGLATMFQRR